ncbi:rhamnulokinase [Schleiferilactobacillus shenzhenensis]|nr:rhamnulokinase family protein [Schleiferilactobacillus shenzhenensis]
MATENLIAVDLGASSGRVMSGQFNGKRITLKEQFRFSNLPVQVTGGLYWDYMKIVQEIKYGLSIAQNDLGELASMSIDTWGVDYGVLSQRGEVLLAPHSYRDTRVQAYTDAFTQRITPRNMFQLTGQQPADINTNLQLYADWQRYPFLADQAGTILLMPGLVSYLLSGVGVNEFSIASTTGLLTSDAPSWNRAVLDMIGIKPSQLADLAYGGAVLGELLPAIRDEVHLRPGMKVIAGAGHDTAAALLALPIPPRERWRTAFISCGTWSIVGRETEAPIINDAAYAAGLTNEGCFDGHNRLLKNITGLWIIQELQREWSFQGEMIDFGAMTDEARAARTQDRFIDPSHPLFSTPGRMEEKIRFFLTATGQSLPRSRGALLRIVLQSLALSYKQVITQLQALTSEPMDSVHMFGGGIQNGLLVQLTADALGLPVVTGPIEASALGNIISQLIVTGVLTSDASEVATASAQPTTVAPTSEKNGAAHFQKFQDIQALAKTAVSATVFDQQQAE